ncbi:unnamed protein product [Fraxinus pennsylvanica]|uniref:SAM domain-containing protein n=1 Tax=Fraxinus pennsylvanica TaxID=56036 RepID=A0AAD2AKU4_9LAMI|nr:unnamed protein product [Fraxinus pennsylvanica]
MSKDKEKPPEPLDFFIWTVEDVGLWLEEINLGGYCQIFKENGINGEYLEGMSMFTTEQILRFIRKCHMKWGDFITLCKELRRIKVACLKGEQKIPKGKYLFLWVTIFWQGEGLVGYNNCSDECFSFIGYKFKARFGKHDVEAGTEVTEQGLPEVDAAMTKTSSRPMVKCCSDEDGIGCCCAWGTCTDGGGEEMKEVGHKLEVKWGSDL